MNKKYVAVCAAVVALVLCIVIAISAKPEKEEKTPVSNVSENVKLDAHDGSYSLNVTAVYDTAPDTDEPNPPEAQRVAVVVYEYTNEDISSGLSIGNTHFKAYDKNGRELQQFPQKGLFEVGEAGKSDTYTASVAFALNNDENYMKIEFYNDAASETPDAVYEKEW